MTIDKPTSLEIENMIHRTQTIRDEWRGNPGYARCLDVELHALRLLLFTTLIAEEEENIAVRLGHKTEGSTADA